MIALARWSVSLDRVRPWVLPAVLAAGAAAAQTPVQVPVAAVALRAVGQGFEMDGVIQPVRQSTVSAQTSGRLVSLAVKAGDPVRAGQLLATINDSETQAGVQSSQAQLAQAQAQLGNAQAQFDRTRGLLAKGFISQAAMDNAQAQLRTAQATLDQAKAGATQAGLAQGFTRVTAPFDAWVLQTHLEQGDLAMPGAPVVTLYAPQPLRAVVQVPVSQSALAARGSAELQVTGPNGALHWVAPTQVVRVPGADPVSQTIEWRLDLPVQATAGFLPGQQVRVRFAAGETRRLTVPAASVLHRGELTAVYVASGKQFVLKAVRLGARHGDQGYEVLAGLQDRDMVALDPVRAGLAGAQVAGGAVTP